MIIAKNLEVLGNNYNYYKKEIEKLKNTKDVWNFTMITSIVSIIVVISSFLGILIPSIFLVLMGEPGIIIFLIILEILVIVIIAGVIVGAVILDKNKIKKDKENRAKKITELEKKKDSELEKYNIYIEKRDALLGIIPIDYFFPIALEYFIEVLGNGRAEDLRDAMNLFEEQLHRWKIEDMTRASMIAQQQAAAAQQRIAANTSAIKTSSAISAGANVATAINSFRR